MVKPKIGITVGDVNGIGPEIIIKTFSDKRILNQCTPVIYGSDKVFKHYKKLLQDNHFAYELIESSDDLKDDRVNMIDCSSENDQLDLGKITETGGRLAHVSIDYCLHDLKKNAVDAMVTAPINKKSMQLAGFKFPGHTEYLQHESNGKALMILCNDNLRVSLVTTHISVAEISKDLTKDRIIATIDRTNKSLIRDFGIERPLIAVLGLNPHAGDGGVIGSEEENFIKPAIKEAKAKGIFAHGPFGADGFFGSQAFSNYDAVIAMYHDQGLVGFKSLAFGNGVNFTAGLDIVRTSPDHGTGFDIVGQGKANPVSFRNALYAAIDIYRNRKSYVEDRANKLVPTKKHKEK